MSVFGDIVKEVRYIDDKIYVSFDEENYNRLELKLKVQEDEIERLNIIINRIKSIYSSLCFSAPENNYI